MKTLILYYSRTGHTKKIADEIATHLSADLEEIIDLKSRTGISGVFEASKDAILQHATSIAELKSNLEDYDLIIIGTPVWFYGVTSAVRTFLTQYANKIKQIAFFTTMGGSGDKRTFEQMQKICNLVPLATTSFSEREIKHEEEYKKKIAAFINALPR